MTNDIANTIRKWINYFCWVPLLLGTIGFMQDGFDFINSVYNTIGLYALSIFVDSQNLLIWIARYSAVIVTANVIISIFAKAISGTSQFFINLRANSTAIYTDSDYGAEINQCLKNSYIVESLTNNPKINTTISKKAKRHVFIFENDETSIEEYNRYKNIIGEKPTFILLNSIDSFIFRNQIADTSKGDQQDIHSKKRDLTIVNMQELLARKFWEGLYDALIDFSRDNKVHKIAISNYNVIGKYLFRQAYLNNLFSVNQKFEYHIWGCDSYERSFIEKLDAKKETINSKDSYIIEDSNCQDDINKLVDSDIVIITDEENSMELIERIIHNSAAKIPTIYFYCNTSNALNASESLFQFENILSFGNINDIITEDKIIDAKISKLAMLVAKDYKDYFEWRDLKNDKQNRIKDEYKDDEFKMELEFKKLYREFIDEKFGKNLNEEKILEDAKTNWYENEATKRTKNNVLIGPFEQGSNVARAIHLPIEHKLKNKYYSNANELPKELMELEHIRWCRYYLYNNWEYPTQEDMKLDKIERKEKKKHQCLLSYDELSTNDKFKDGIYNQQIESIIKGMLNN
ncbi:MAG: hypothetical protein MJ189_03575 [Coriobacteriales bacterium]|nr:hypothetical protein [Coriobacteriales bacterium]